MAGINLSQSLQEKEAAVRGTFFDTGLYINIGVLALVLLVFGGGKFYLSHLNKQLAGVESEIAAKLSTLQGDEVNRIADFRVRLDMIEEALNVMPQHEDLFAQLERKMVSNTKITLYQENWSEGTVEIAGVTDGMRYVAQQMLAYKTLPRVEKVIVNDLGFNDVGKLEFSLELSVARASETVTSL